jgi:membrane-bound metal-dependent hydrolase YbcI (DUF457 family)
VAQGVNRPGHKWIATATGLGTCAAITPAPAHAAIIVGVGIYTCMGPDKSEGLKILRWRLRLFKHRGVTHRLWAMLLFVALVTLPALMFENDAGERILLPYAGAIALGALVGYGSHLILGDGITKTGIPWRGRRLWLLPKRWRVSTRGGKTPGERRVILLAKLASAGFIVMLWPG